MMGLLLRAEDAISFDYQVEQRYSLAFQLGRGRSYAKEVCSYRGY